MKNTKLYFGLLALVMFAFVACEHMNDYHFEYIKDGEISYTTKLDSVETFAGNNRVEIMGVLLEAFGVDKIKVLYNNGNDSMMADYVRVNEVDTVSIMLDGLDEKSYTFEIYTEDLEGNRSVKVTTFATAYGEIFRSNLYARGIDSDSARGSTIFLNWLPSDEKERGTELKYTNNSDEEVFMELSRDSSFTALEDFKEGIQFRSLFVPEVTALDSFGSDWVDLELKIFASSGVFTHPLLGARPFALDKVLKKVTASSYETNFADLGGPPLNYRMKLKVDELNNVEVISMGTTPTAVPNGVNTYDPATETYTLNYKYEHLTGPREITETLVRK